MSRLSHGIFRGSIVEMAAPARRLQHEIPNRLVPLSEASSPDRARAADFLRPV
jgi:hypothetical protein